MKAILEFNLPDERNEYLCAARGSQYVAALEELDNYLRSRLKYEELDDSVYEALEKARNKLHEELGARDLELFW